MMPQGSASWWEGDGWLGEVGVWVKLLRGDGTRRPNMVRSYKNDTSCRVFIIGICMNTGSPGNCVPSLAMAKGGLAIKLFVASATNANAVAKMFAKILFHANVVTIAHPKNGRNATNWTKCRMPLASRQREKAARIPAFRRV